MHDYIIIIIYKKKSYFENIYKIFIKSDDFNNKKRK